MNDKGNEKPILKAIDQVRQIRMTEGERARVRAKLAEMIAQEQAADATAASDLRPDKRRPVKSTFASWGFILAGLAIVILFGAGTTAAAERALPGDRLYGFKVRIVEPVVGAFRGTSDKLAMWQASLVSERLSEAETLASEGRLNDERRDKIEKLLDKHTADLNVALDDTARRDSPEKAAGIGESLRESIIVHVRQLDDIIVHASSSTAASTTRAARSISPDAIRSARDIKDKATTHVRDLKASWTAPLPPQAQPTTTDETIQINAPSVPTSTVPSIRGDSGRIRSEAAREQSSASMKAAAPEAVSGAAVDAAFDKPDKKARR